MQICRCLHYYFFNERITRQVQVQLTGLQILLLSITQATKTRIKT